MTAYVRALVQPLAADARVLCWDLCNEPPGTSLESPDTKKQYAWLSAMATTARTAGARQPIIIGTMTGPNITLFSPLVDVLCAHPYAKNREDLVKMVDGFREMSRKEGKPLLVNECVPGSLDDAKRAEASRYYLEILSEAGFGWMPWSIKEGKAIATRRDRIDGNGIDSQGYHVTFTAANRLRPGLEFLKEKAKLRAPWEKA